MHAYACSFKHEDDTRLFMRWQYLGQTSSTQPQCQLVMPYSDSAISFVDPDKDPVSEIRTTRGSALKRHNNSFPLRPSPVTL